MELLIHCIVFASGLAALIVGGNGLVRGASSFAQLLGISPVVVGLTVVAFGTSAPELAVSLTSGLSDYAGLALGNVVGSNVFNILLILGVAALIQPLRAEGQLIRFDAPIMVLSCILLTVLSLDGEISRLEGVALSVCLLVYLAITVWRVLGSKSRDDVADPEVDGTERLEREDWMLSGIALTLAAVTVMTSRLPVSSAGALAAGLVIYLGFAHMSDKKGANHLTSLMILGFAIFAVTMAAHCMVDGAVAIARHFGVSDAVIGLTVVAAGTSLPEAVTTVAAGRQGQAGIAIGNVIGSNIFNVLCIVGITGSVVSLPVSSTLLEFDFAFMVASAALACVILWVKSGIGRRAGLGFLACFAGYIAVQVSRVL